MQLINTAIPFVLLWAFMAKTVLWGWNDGWTVALAVPMSGLFIRLLIIQHDCGHGSFFASRKVDHVVGAALGVVTLFPYGYWKKTHAIHHATSGNLDRREFGDARTLTVEEYLQRSALKRFGYREESRPRSRGTLRPLLSARRSGGSVSESSVANAYAQHNTPFTEPFASQTTKTYGLERSQRRTCRRNGILKRAVRRSG